MAYRTQIAVSTTMPAHVLCVPVLTSLMMNITVSVHQATLATTALRVSDHWLFDYAGRR